MKYIINENQVELLQKTFNKLMSNLSDLREVERVYDFYDYKRNSYVDYTPINFYDTTGDEEGDAEIWELDDWVFQYAKEPPYGEKVEGYPTPVLLYPRNRFKNLIGMFDNKFDYLLKKWFEVTYGYKVNTILDDYEADKFIPYS